MPSSDQNQPPRFAVQRAKGRGWKTMVVYGTASEAEAAFREVVRINPRGCFRMIRLDHRPDAGGEGMAFDWKLLALHDPRGAGGAEPGRRKVAVPWRLYLLMLLAGAVLAALLYMAIGPQLFGLSRGR